MNRRIVHLGVSLAALALLVTVPAAFAFERRAGETLVIEAGEVIPDDLYAVAQTFVLNGQVQGDVIVFAQTVEINGIVDGDVIAIAQSVRISGRVGDDVRAAAMDVTLSPSASVGDDVAAAAFSLETQSGASAGGVVYAGAQALLQGTVDGSALVYADALEVRGRIAGDLEATVGKAGSEPAFPPGMFFPNRPALPAVTAGLTITDGASIGGRLDYRAAGPGRISPAAQIGQIVFTPVKDTEVTQEHKPREETNFALDRIRNFAALFLVGLLAIWLTPAWLQRSADTLQSRPWQSLGRGLLVLSAAGLAFFALLIGTIVLSVFWGTLTLTNLLGTTLALGLLGLFAVPILVGVAAAYGAQVTVGFTGGRWIFGRLAAGTSPNRIGAMALGIAVLVLLRAVPLIGGLGGFAVTLFGLGAIWLALTEGRRVPSLAAVPAPAPAAAARAPRSGATRRTPRRTAPKRRARR
jgi:cytoskeletal protein CcmA (bactofilin family)